MAKSKSLSMKSLRSFRNQIKESKPFKDEANKVSLRVFKSIQKDFFDEFDNHPVTKEIEGGISASNISGTLGGYGNLFSFIGFNSSDMPIIQLREALRSMMRVSRVKTRKGRDTKVYFDISIPTMKVISSVTPMPWENGRSWVSAVERGISGFGYYMSTQERRFSRSGGGVQVDTRIRPGAYTPIKYMSQMLKDLSRNLRRLA
tara:strand:- start:970 stop:1578 length:609 start_codon:yes stop_codon:yes gene_type:complete